MRMRLRMKVTRPGKWSRKVMRDCATDAPGRRGPPPPAGARMREDVSSLAADEREGRGPGTRGIDEAADYISFVFRSAGLKPAPGPDGYFQPFTIGGSPSLGRGQELA